ncbi:putative protein kinase RLK-Pelle-SD-2b family [Helianthus anomalus]
MNDTGNFVIVDGISRKVWESFRFPTDTILPTQVMEILFLGSTIYLLRRLIVVIVGTCVVVIFLSNGVICVGFFRIRKNTTTNHSPCSKTVDTNLARFTYQELVEATSGFKDELNWHASQRDLPQNILLDDCYNAKISDFGLAKLLMMDQSRTSTGIRGTKGHVAPEWFRNTEMISCRKSVIVKESDSKDVVAVLTDWAWDCYQEGRLEVFLENDSEALDDYKRLMTFIKSSFIHILKTFKTQVCCDLYEDT